jgi:hypothetical protein
VNREAGGAVPRPPDWLWAAAAAFGLAFVIWQVVAAGSWLDEYWQLWIAGAPADLLAGRLVADSHPPWFNLFARAIIFATGGAIVPARLINLAAAVAALGLGLWRLHGLDRRFRWRLFLLIVASSGAVGMSGLASSFRSYAWILSLSALQAAVLTAVLLKRPVPVLMTALVTTASVAIHYVHAAGAIAIALVSLALAWRGNRPAFRAVLIGLLVGSALDLATGLAQLAHGRPFYDVNWIAQSGGGGAFATFGAVTMNFVFGNAIAAALLVVGLMARRSRRALVILSPIPLALIGWAIFDASAPILLPRYMPSVTALLTTAAALSWTELALTPVAEAVTALLVALQPFAGAFSWPPVPGWEAGARIAAKVVERCPEARLYAVSPWRFRDQPDSKMARFEEPVIGFGYRTVGAEFGLRPDFVRGPTTIEMARCPAIVWMEAAHGIERAPPEAVLRRAQLRLPVAAKARMVATPNGGVLLISPADRLQPRS